MRHSLVVLIVTLAAVVSAAQVPEGVPAMKSSGLKCGQNSDPLIISSNTAAAGDWIMVFVDAAVVCGDGGFGTAVGDIESKSVVQDGYGRPFIQGAPWSGHCQQGGNPGQAQTFFWNWQEGSDTLSGIVRITLGESHQGPFCGQTVQANGLGPF